MESAKLDTYEKHSLSLEVFSNLIFAKSYRPTIEVIDKTLDCYNSIIQCPKERLLDMIVFERQNIIRNYNGVIGGFAPTLYFSDIMWEYVYTLAYYLNHNSSLWKTHLLPRMKELTRVAAIKDDLKKAEELVDEYIDRRMVFEQDLHNDTPAQPEQKTPAFHIAENHKTDAVKVFAYMFDEDLFVNADGSPLKRQKTQFMKALGEFFGDDFTNYARIINKAAQEPNFPGIFEHMYMRSKRKYVYTK